MENINTEKIMGLLVDVSIETAKIMEILADISVAEDTVHGEGKHQIHLEAIYHHVNCITRAIDNFWLFRFAGINVKRKRPKL